MGFEDDILNFMLSSDLVFYAVMALLSSLPLFFLVAAISLTSLVEARLKTMKFLEDWGQVMPEKFRGGFVTAVGYFGGFIFLIFLAFIFNSMGRFLLPDLVKSTGFPSSDLATVWFAENQDVWKAFERRYQRSARAESSEFDWRQDKANLGKPAVKSFRVVAIASVMLFIAGFIDIFSSSARRRGWVLSIVALFCFLLFFRIWADKQSLYMGRLYSANLELATPAVLPAGLESIIDMGVVESDQN